MNPSSKKPDRSHLFPLQVRGSVRTGESIRMLEVINAAHGDLPDPVQDLLLAHMRVKHRGLLVLTPGDVEA